MSLPSIKHIRQQPAFVASIWRLQPHKSGLLAVAADRGGPYRISWEVHGIGPVKVILVGGIGIIKSDFQQQILYFGHQKGSQFSVLIVDNLGVGKSDWSYAPRSYSTSNMAQNILEVADHLEWTDRRQLHVGGGSMGGMIVQEIGWLAPDRLASLTLWSTAAKFENTGSIWNHFGRIIAMLTPKSTETSLQDTAKRSFTLDWLTAPDNAKPPTKDAQMCQTPDIAYKSFDNNYARWAAQEILKRENGQVSGLGFLMQAQAAGMHSKSPEQLRELKERVGRERIMIIHGTADKGVLVELGKKLIDLLEPATSFIVESMGHHPFMERPTWFNSILAEHFQSGEDMNQQTWTAFS